MVSALPLLDEPPHERSDAARNREALLRAALDLIEEHGIDAVTMEAVATRAGVGKGTLFRRFDSRAGLMGAVLDLSEAEWQASVISGLPPLGPGAPALDRLLAFGETRLRLNLRHAALIEAAGNPGARSLHALSFTTMHVRMLLTQLDVEGDLAYLATALVAPLELFMDVDSDHSEETIQRLQAGWADLVRRVVSR